MSVEKVTDEVARLEPEHLDRQVQRRRPRVDHDPAALGEGRGHHPLHLLDVATDAHRARTAAQHRDHGLDLFFVVDTAGVLDSLHGNTMPASID
jgi:hypothetical protein